MKSLPLNSTDRIDLASLVESKLLVQANSGGGKSWLIRRLLEQSHGQVQHIVLDIEGEFGTLREKFDYLHCGRGADVPAEPRSAALLARKLLELGVSAIIDLYELDHNDRKRFVRFFCDALTNAPKELWHPVLVVIDEAHRFAPEKGQSEALDAVINLCSQGRKRGFGVVLATQRLSKLHKDAAAECNNKLIGRTGLDIDRKRAAEELGFTSKEQVLSLRTLAPGEFYAFGPAISNEVKSMKVGPVETTHPKVGHRAKVKAAPPTAKVKEAIRKLTDLPAEAKKEAETVEVLKREIVELKRAAAHEAKRLVADPAEIKRQHERGIQEGRRQVSADLKPIIETAKKVIQGARNAVNHPDVERLLRTEVAVARLPKPETAIITQLARRDGTPAKQVEVPVTTRRWEPEPTEGMVALSKGEMSVLNAVAQHHPVGMTREHITVQLGYKRSSRDTFIQRLKAKGFIHQHEDRISVTDDGFSALGSNFQPLPTGPELRQKVLSELPEGERRVLAVIAEHYPAFVPRERIDELTGYKRSSRDTFIQRLKSRELVEDVAGAVKASENLF